MESQDHTQWGGGGLFPSLQLLPNLDTFQECKNNCAHYVCDERSLLLKDMVLRRDSGTFPWWVFQTFSVCPGFTELYQVVDSKKTKHTHTKYILQRRARVWGVCYQDAMRLPFLCCLH